MRTDDVVRVLAAVDPANPLADRRLPYAVMDAALSLASRYDAPLYVVHAWHAYGETVLRHHAAPRAVRAHVQRSADDAARNLEAFLSGFTGELEPARVVLAKGAPADVIDRVARELEVDVIVMGTSGRSGLAGLVIGDTAKRVSARAPCPVVVVRAPDFTPSPTIPRAVALRGSGP